MSLDFDTSKVIENNSDGKIEMVRGGVSPNNRIFFKNENIIDDEKTVNVPIFKSVVMICHVLDEYSTNVQIANLSGQALGLSESEALDRRYDFAGVFDDEKYPQEWKAFESARRFMQSGTPLQNWHYFLNKPEIIATLNASNIYKVEELKSIPERLKSVIPNSDEMIKESVKFLSMMNDKSLVAGLETENQAKDAKIAELEALLENMKQDNAKPSKKVA